MEDTNDEKVTPEQDARQQAQVVQLIEFVTSNPAISLFHDEYGEGYVRLPLGTHCEVWPCSSSGFKRWLSKSFYESTGKVPNQNVLSGALQVISAKAEFDNDELHLGTRVVQRRGRILYDLTDKEWRAVRVLPTGWNIEADVPPYFRRYAYQAAQVEPVLGGDIRDALKFVNIKRPDHQLLFLVGLCAYFVPGSPRPIFYFHGPQGSAKTTASKILRKLIDPSRVEVLTLPRNIEELKQALAHYYFLSFDNVGYIPADVSDLLCQAVTGSGFSKRKLYTDDEDIIRTVRANLSINSITIGSTRADFLERSVLIELERVSKQDRRQEHEIMDEFEKARPALLGAVFTALSKALSIQPTVQTANLPRMADFTIWGAALAEAIGYTQKEFLDAYWQNIDTQNDEVLSDNPTASLVLALMNDRKEWSGTAAALLKELHDLSLTLLIADKELPRSPSALSRELSRLESSLGEEGLFFSRSGGATRTLTISHLPANAAPAVTPSRIEDWLPENDANDANDGDYGDSYTGKEVLPGE